jgi:hypothetical protein
MSEYPLEIFNVIFFVLYVNAARRVWGLSGGYGKGVWSTHSTYWVDACEARNKSLFFFIVVSAINIFRWV